MRRSNLAIAFLGLMLAACGGPGSTGADLATDAPAEVPADAADVPTDAPEVPDAMDPGPGDLVGPDAPGESGGPDLPAPDGDDGSPGDAVADVLADVPAEAAPDVAVDLPGEGILDVPGDTPGDAAADGISDVPAEAAPDAAVDLPGEGIPDVLDDTPGDVPPDAPDNAFTRPEKGDPVSTAEMGEITTMYLDLLSGMRWFDLLDERVHGWPESDPEQKYWYGSWWSGVRILKQDGKVTYRHSSDGADNNGMRTAPMLVAAAYAHQLGGNPGHLHLLRRLVRGFNSWILAMERESQPGGPTLMTRASYPPSTTWTWGGREVYIDYSLNHPGEDNGACQYVHLPDNPTWGDLWVKNMRSKDDIGHMLLGIALIKNAVEASTDTDLKAEWAQLMDLYGKWSRQVEDDGWRIATYDKDLAKWLPEDDLAIYMMDINGVDPECDIALATRLMGRGDGGDLDCGNGISEIDDLISMKPSNGQQLRSYHEAALALARVHGQDALVAALLPGMALRIDKILDADPEAGGPPRPNDEDLGELMIMADAVGVPLTWREVRFIHDRIRDAHQAYLAPGALPGYRVFDPETPDGEYSFDPGGAGFAFRYVGAVISACASPFRAPSSHPILDCDLVRAAFAR